jgi:hypothetical protein
MSPVSSSPLSGSAIISCNSSCTTFLISACNSSTVRSATFLLLPLDVRPRPGTLSYYTGGCRIREENAGGSPYRSRPQWSKIIPIIRKALVSWCCKRIERVTPSMWFGAPMRRSPAAAPVRRQPSPWPQVMAKAKPLASAAILGQDGPNHRAR